MKKSLLIIIISCFFVIEKVQAVPFSVIEFNVLYKTLYGLKSKYKTLAFSFFYAFNFEKHSGLLFEASFPEYIRFNKVSDKSLDYARPLINYKIGYQYSPSIDGFYVRIGYNHLTYKRRSDRLFNPEIEKLSAGGFFIGSGLYFDAKYIHIDMMAEVEFAGEAFVLYQISLLKIRLFNK